jgi:EAL domain-containing protein (putative c-di-GMP-specific phosphodiesterase class I)
MRPTGDWVLQTVCRQIAEWLAAGVSPVPVAINLSAAQLNPPGEFERQVSAELSRWQVPPEMLKFELSESVLMEMTRKNDVDPHGARLRGLNLVVDGFGGGYLSLDQFVTFGIACLKISPRLAAVGDDERSSTAPVRAAIGLARELGIAIMSGGVEDAVQLAFLTSVGCPVVQGSHICPPLAADRIGYLLRQGRIAGPVLAGSADLD